MMIVDAANHAIAMNAETQRMCMEDANAPHILMKPKLSLDGNQWCFLLGGNLASGLAGFGKSPALAAADFDVAWFKQNAPTQAPHPTTEPR